MIRKNVYLGIKVPDIGKPKLDKLVETKGICKVIYDEYIHGRIVVNQSY